MIESLFPSKNNTPTTFYTSKYATKSRLQGQHVYGQVIERSENNSIKLTRKLLLMHFCVRNISLTHATEATQNAWQPFMLPY